MISQPAVLTTSPAGTTFATTNNSGETAYVSVGANGATMANYWVSAVSVATSAASFLCTVPAGGTIALQYTVAVPVWYWSPYTPALPLTTVPVTNNTGKNISVVFAAAGTVTVIHVNGVTTNITQDASKPVALPPGATIDMTYSAAPMWAWLDYLPTAPLPNSNGSVYAQMNTQAPTGAAGYSPYNALSYPPHVGGGLANLFSGVSN